MRRNRNRSTGPMADHAAPRNEILRTSKRLGRTIRRRWRGASPPPVRGRLRTRSPPEPCRAAGPAAERKGFRPSGRRVPDPCGRAQRLHRARHPGRRGFGIFPPGKGDPRPSVHLCNRVPRGAGSCQRPVPFGPGRGARPTAKRPARGSGLSPATFPTAAARRPVRRVRTGGHPPAAGPHPSQPPRPPRPGSALRRAALRRTAPRTARAPKPPPSRRAARAGRERSPARRP